MLKLRIGPPPENATVVGDGSWKPVSGYDATRAGALRMLSVGLACMLIAIGLWTALVPGSLPIAWPSVKSTLLVLFVLVVVHEALHLLAFPGAGVGNAVAGIWPAKGAAYVQYTLPAHRRRFVLATLTPVSVLSVGVLVAALSGVQVPVALQWASVLNAFGSGADLLVVYSLMQQSSPSALVLESAQKLYTREA